MIYPTEMTLTTGTTVYAGDPDSDQRIQSREVRVSVTFQIEEEEDFDLSDLAYAKAAEVERARIAAVERIRDMENAQRDRRATCGAAFDDPAFDPSAPGLEPPDEDGDDRGGDDPDPFPQEADYLSGPSGHGVNGRAATSAPPWVAPTGANGPLANQAAAHQATRAETDWATRPQVLAIGSHFKRLGISPQDQTALLRDRFGKFRLERLTRDEAAGLMRSLERGEFGGGHGEAVACVVMN